MNDKRPIYNRIKAVLAEKGKANLWLAETLGKNKATVSKWCTNETQPSVETLFQIAKALNVDVRELLVPNKVN
jgi:putative transcriptional regulator